MKAIAILALCMPGVLLAQSAPMNVDRATQAQRDVTRRQIIEQERSQEQALLEDAKEALTRTQGQSASSQALREKQEAVQRHTANVASLDGELARLPAESMLKSAAEEASGSQPNSGASRVGNLPGAAPSSGVRNPRREAVRAHGNPRLVVFPYDRNNTYPVHLMEGLSTHFEFPEGEYVKTLTLSNCGQDSPFWSCILSGDRRHVWIKPKLPEQTDVGTIVTNRRVYEISLHAVKPGRDWYQRVTWDGGWEDQGFYEFREAPAKSASDIAQTHSPKSPATDPERMRFGYAIEGDAPFRPQMVFDDGKFTWIKLAANVQELPALFVLSGEDVELVNYTQRGEYLLVNRLVPGLLLKLGKAEVRVRNPSYLAKR